MRQRRERGEGGEGGGVCFVSVLGSASSPEFLLSE